MILLQCIIENFGKLSDVSFDFSEGVNTFCEENGWGKSTLANFIRIMFFGFLNGNKQDKLVNERKRYFPWQSAKGVYGGSVKFETEGKSYQLNRVFGKKTKMIFLNSMTFRQTFRARIFPRISVLNYLVLMRHPLAAQYFFHRRTASLHRPTGFMRNLAI